MTRTTTPPLKLDGLAPALPATSLLREYYELCKPRVVMLIVFTAIVGMFLAVPGLPPLAVSVSIGVAALGEDDERHVDTALHPADQALQRAKNSGRNRVVVAP